MNKEIELVSTLVGDFWATVDTAKDQLIVEDMIYYPCLIKHFEMPENWFDVSKIYLIFNSQPTKESVRVGKSGAGRYYVDQHRDSSYNRSVPMLMHFSRAFRRFQEEHLRLFNKTLPFVYVSVEYEECS